MEDKNLECSYRIFFKNKYGTTLLHGKEEPCGYGYHDGRNKTLIQFLVCVVDEPQGNEISGHHGAADKKAVEKDVGVHQVEPTIGYGFYDVHGSRCGRLADDVGNEREVECEEHGTAQWSRYAQLTVDAAGQCTADEHRPPPLG